MVNLVHSVVCHPMFVCGGGAFGAKCWCSMTLETRRVVVIMSHLYLCRIPIDILRKLVGSWLFIMPQK